MRISIAAAVFAAAALSAVTRPAPADAAVPTVDWSIDRASPARPHGNVQLTVRARWGARSHGSNWSSGIALSELRGFDPSRLAALAAAPVRFALVREAGRLDCGGSAGRGAGRGTCGFTPDSAFAAELARRGIGRPGHDRLFAMAMGNVGRSHLDALAAARVPRPTLDELTALGIHGASPAYIRASAYAGLGGGALDAGDVTAMAIHGVTPAFIGELSRLGYRRVPAGDLVQMRIFGVTPAFIRSVHARTGRLPSASELVQLRLFGTRGRGR